MIEYLEEVLQEYDIGGYIIGEEHEPYNHFHFMVQMKAKDYHKFSVRIFKKLYQLRGQAKSGQPRQYGKVKEINNVEKMQAYTLKNGKFKSNLSVEQIENLKAVAHEKNIDIEFDHKICRLIELHLGTEKQHELTEIKLQIIKELLNLNIKTVPTKGKINKIATLWFWQYAKVRNEYTIYESLYGIMPM